MCPPCRTGSWLWVYWERGRQLGPLMLMTSPPTVTGTSCLRGLMTRGTGPAPWSSGGSGSARSKSSITLVTSRRPSGPCRGRKGCLVYLLGGYFDIVLSFLSIGEGKDKRFLSFLQFHSFLDESSQAHKILRIPVYKRIDGYNGVRMQVITFVVMGRLGPYNRRKKAIA